MDNPATQDPVPTRFRQAIADIYGDRLDRVILSGSRARGDFRPDSDYDIAVFLRGMGGLWKEPGPLAEIATDILVDTGAVISAKPFEAAAYGQALPLMEEIHRDGLEL